MSINKKDKKKAKKNNAVNFNFIINFKRMRKIVISSEKLIVPSVFEKNFFFVQGETSPCEVAKDRRNSQD